MEEENLHPGEKSGVNQFIRSSVIFLFLIVFAAAPANTHAETAKPAVNAINPITEAAVKAGVRSCKDRINQVSNFLTSNTNSGWLLFQPTSQPDRRLISVSMEAATKDVSSAYISESFAPNQANGCAGLYETVVYWEKGCFDVAKKQFATFKRAGVLSKNISVLDGGAGVRVFLMPAGKGCVAIKKEVFQ
jgi:hypothetical protein